MASARGNVEANTLPIGVLCRIVSACRYGTCESWQFRVRFFIRTTSHIDLGR